MPPTGARRAVRPVAVDGADGTVLLEPMRAALNGSGPALHAHQRGAALTPGAVADLAPEEDSASDPVAAVVATSGSTGAPKHALLPASALLASAAGTHDRLGGSGTWVLAVPTHTVAGLMVLVRSLVARTHPVVVDLAGGFRADAFVAATSSCGGGRRYTSLVPTQLRRLLEAGQSAHDALRSFDAVLVGGSRLDPGLRAAAGSAGVRVVATYGMTETCGGCVYDGRALPGVTVAVTDDGRVELAGAVLARGYRGAEDGFGERDGVRWFRTEDAGVLRGDVLEVRGRLDDVAVTGGVNVPLPPVQDVVAALPGVRACLAVAVADQEWGEVVGVLVEGDGSTAPPDLATVRSAVARRLGREHAPRRLVVVDRLPLRGVGKPDRARARTLLGAPDDTASGRSGDHGGSAEPGGTRATCDI